MRKTVARPYSIEVSGSGEFPLYMLLETHCWPETMADIQGLILKDRRTVTLQTNAFPSDAVVLEWETIGWKITRLDGVTQPFKVVRFPGYMPPAPVPNGPKIQLGHNGRAASGISSCGVDWLC